MPPIWKIKNKPFWFVGTLHFLKEEDYPISDTLQEAVNVAELLVLEDKDFLLKGHDIGIYNDGKTIQSELSPQAIDLLIQRCTDVGFDFDIVQPFRPWRATLVVSTTLCNSIGFSLEHGLDKYLLDTFQSANNSIDSLEDSIKALLLFDQLSLEVQESFLIKSLESIERMTSQIESLHEAWRLGSEKLVTQFVHEPLKMIPSFYQKLILDRNVAWLQKITKLINDNNSTLIAVGAGHFLGESNIIDALINAGHNIERLT
jgi:uncharacterized protein YbaP (TraB family)